MNSTKKQTISTGTESIDFDKPSGDVIGLSTAFAVINGKRITICNAVFLLNADTRFIVNFPKRVNAELAIEIAKLITEFSQFVAAKDKARVV